MSSPDRIPNPELEAAARASMEGDLQAMGELVELTHLRLRGFLRTICADPTAIDDLAQETYVTAFRKIHRLDSPGSAMPFLLGIARNHAMNHIRKAGRRADIEEAHVEEIADRLLKQLGQADLVPPSEMGVALGHCMGRLATKDRDLVHQRYALDRNSADLSASTGQSQTAIRTRLMRLRERLRNCIQEQLALADFPSAQPPPAP